VRPLKLRLAGFTCYSDPAEIDFRGMDIFAVTGPTGAGKSTIVDAICYALYGRVPRHAETTSLISHNRDSMSVDLEFDAAGKQYRVHRGINQTRRTGRDGREVISRAPSPVQLEEKSGEEWMPIAGRVQDIDDEIEKIVGLDYKSFTVCVLLPQGRFQDFLAGEKKDRRQVLTDLLDIGIYQQVMTAANSHASKLADDAGAIGRRLAEDYAGATPEALDDVRAQMEQAGPRLALAQSQREALTEALGLAETVMSARRRQIERTEAHSALLEKIAEAEALARDGQDRLTSLKAQHAKARADLESVSYDRARHSALERARDQVRARTRFKADLAAARKEAADDVPLKEAAAVSAAASKRLARASEEVGSARDAVEAAARLHAAAHIRASLKAGDPCPVCGAAVGRELPPLEAHAADAEEALKAALDAELSGREALKAAEAVLAAEQARREAAAKQVQRIEKDLAASESELAALLPAGVKAAERQVEAALNQEAERAERFHELSERESSLRGDVDALAPRVAGSETTLAQLRGQAGALEAEAVQAGLEAETAKTSLIKLAVEWEWHQVSDLIKAKQAPNQAIATQLRGTNNEIDALTRLITSLEGDERRIEQGIERAAKLREEQEALTARGLLYKDLANLLRADQFQAFVVEEAMVALAQAATRHLVEIHPRFGLDVEKDEFVVVDHWQADQVRAARTLSGGETFVASLALALALSERVPELRSAASASLDSLFLDEGFGTLDPDSLSEVIDALEALRSEERLVGIITHVPELARRIECRIEVQKSQEGSRLTVVGT